MTARRILQQARDERGTAAVEFSLVGSLLILLLFAILDLGLLVNARLVLTQAARAGIRQAAIDGGASPRSLRVIREQLALAGLDGPATRVLITPRTAAYGTILRVTIAHDYRLKTPLGALAGKRGLRLGVTLFARSERLAEGNGR